MEGRREHDVRVRRGLGKEDEGMDGGSWETAEENAGDKQGKEKDFTELKATRRPRKKTRRQHDKGTMDSVRRDEEKTED